MVGGGQRGTPGLACRVVLWGCHDGTGDVAATHTAATQCWPQDCPALGSGGNGSGGPGRTCTPPVGQVGGCAEESLARFDMHLQR